MINRNYKFEKRQKDLAKSKKKEEKLQRKLAKGQSTDEESAPAADGQNGASVEQPID